MQMQECERISGALEAKSFPFARGGAFKYYSLLASILMHAHMAPGLYIELGVAWGHSINLTATFTDTVVHGFDTFTGLPTAWRAKHNRTMPVGTFTQHGRVPVTKENTQLHKGLIEKTLPRVLAQHPLKRISWVNFDCDLYSCTLNGLNAIRARLQPGTILHFHQIVSPVGEDEPSDEARALRDFLVGHPDVTFQVIDAAPCDAEGYRGPLAVRLVPSRAFSGAT